MWHKNSRGNAPTPATSFTDIEALRFFLTDLKIVGFYKLDPQAANHKE
jgi:hypothetical protein